MVKKNTHKTNTKKLVLLDAHAIIHRAYHALPDFSNNAGERTGALYGLSTMLMKIITEFAPDYIVACYDLPKPTFRHEVYEGYKAGRPKADSDLISQLLRSRDIFKAFNIPIYDMAGFEADDILGTIVEKLSQRKDVDIIIASGDMDTMQLIDNKRVCVFTLKKGIRDTALYDEDAVIKRFGFKPDLLPDYKGLSGDQSDNIIGVPGIGHKTASALIKKYGTMEKIYKALKNRAKFLEAGFRPRIADLLEEHKQEAEFSKMLAEINRHVPIEFDLPIAHWGETVEPEKIVDLFEEFNFRSLVPRVRELVLKHNCLGDDEANNNADEAGLNVVNNNEEIKDTALALWVLNSEFTNPKRDDILRYTNTKSIEDAHISIIKELKAEGLLHILEDIEMPLVSIVEHMTRRGILLDKKVLGRLSQKLHKDLEKVAHEIFALAGHGFNINSPKQLGVVLYDELGLCLKNHRKTPSGARSTNEKVLHKLQGSHEIIAQILVYRETQKLLSTYIDALPKLLLTDGRLHAVFSQTGTVTGRMSSNNPNLQNIPRRREVRRAFIAESGYKFVSFDYSQIELRIAAIMSGDPKLIDIFKIGEDIHLGVASEVFGVSPEKVDKEMRRKAKAINFGILYGMGVNALREQLGVEREEAVRFYDNYFKTFSRLAEFLDEVRAGAQKTGQTQTLFGRRRSFFGINSPLGHIREQALRMAINAPMQGTCADIIKISMIKIAEFLNKERLDNDVFLLLQIHDELLFEMRDDVIARAVPSIKRIMESVIPDSKRQGVPIVVNVEQGLNWGDLESVEVTSG